jgi:hypothetical protein
MYRTVCLTCLCLFATAASGSEGIKVYKTEDSLGNPVFSDMKTEESEEITVDDPLTFPAEVIKKNAGAFDYEGIRSKATEELPIVYNTLLISSPTDQQVIRNNAGNLTVEVMAERNLAPKHQVELLMDGAPVGVYNGSSFDLQSVDRGEHTLQLQISHSESGEIYKSSPVVSFTMLRYSKLHRVRPTPH